ncbi:immune inhibitor A domain-containing protein [Promethearchaeum syntrophicum]|uniref:Immune inhibitor A domain-containing protein n=1 Tax=Promethearchaeum syntrophicum TaxID=2594042 RepID=A0A5B9D971_9ARCH|nr:immune inhibitor A domain-containing protein [Candidatus Prometheoarchaeum syntrophicum]QEE15709.1 Immune inhibitor A peptidase M6 [Candidatus Prometheoarchaeum syntrophicum]
MKSKYFPILLVTIIVGGIFGGITSFSLLSPNTEYVEQKPYDAGPELRSRKISEYPMTSSLSISPQSSGDSYYLVGDTLEWYVSDDNAEGGIIVDAFQLMALGNLSEVWVQIDMSYPDSRETPVVTTEDAEWFVAEFESNIYPKDTEYFGTPNFHNGSDSILGDLYLEPTGRNVILISNIRDEGYYDQQYPYYVVGFYWGVFEDAFDRNIVSIDSADFANRKETVYAPTLAHEYQHLIHDDYNPLDGSWMNEGCSMFAEPLCGYNIPWGDIEAFLATPDNSLTEWGDQGGLNILADYGQAFMWAAYLADHFGAEFLSYFVQAGIPDVAGIENTLSHFGYTEKFEDIYLDWTIANLLHTDSIGDGKYNYEMFDLNTVDYLRIYNINKPYDTVTGVELGETVSYLQDKTGFYMTGSYGTDYIKLGNIHDRFITTFDFDGDNYATLATWELVDEDGDGDLEYYSTPSAPESDIKLYTEINLSAYGASPLFSFDTKYIIEPNWDYGFVQISTDYGTTWTSLANEYTTYDIEDEGYPAIAEELPGLCGDSLGWINMGFDLSAYAGQVVQLQFRYMTDWGYEDPGWWVDNIALNGEIIDDADGLISFIVPPPAETDFYVTMITAVETDLGMEYHDIIYFTLSELENALESPIDLAGFVEPEEFCYLLVSPTIGLADYEFSLIKG